MKILVGNTGFVGSNLCENEKFDAVFNSKNIKESFGLNPDLLIYSGVPAEKFFANQNPEKDFEIIQNAIENIKKINPKKVVLISTVDVYPIPNEVDETAIIDENNLQPYGKNRLILEQWVENNFSDYLIVRLPGLFGKNLKKNFIYDIINVIPSVLNEKKYSELIVSNQWLETNYTSSNDGFYRLNQVTKEERNQLKEKFLSIGFSALNFTDSRGVFQFYNLKNLANDIAIAMENSIKKLNLATEPISVKELYFSAFNTDFSNEVVPTPPYYNFKSVNNKIYNGENGYLYSKDQVLKDIVDFIKKNK